MKVALAVIIFAVLRNCCVFSQLLIGNACLLTDETPGICRPRSTCSDQNRRNRICGFQEGVRIICCASPVTVPSEIPQVDNTAVISPGSGLVANSESTFNTLETLKGARNPPDGIKATTATLDESATLEVSGSPPTTVPNDRVESVILQKSISKCYLYSREGYEFQRFKFGGQIQTLKVSRCSASGKKVVGGQKALPKEFPHMAALGYGENKLAVTWECDGSLISERFVLTAAHCIGNGTRAPKWVRLGDLNLVSPDDEAEPETIVVEATFRHQEYQPNEYYDIALVKMIRNVIFTAFIRPACLNTISSDFPNSKVIASGWGKNFSSDLQGTNDMMKVQLKVRSLDTCAGLFRHLSRSRLQSGNTSHMICAGETHTDTCQGGSGAPIQVRLKDCMYSILGVLSFGNTGCGTGNNSAVYTRVALVLPWIEETVWP